MTIVFLFARRIIPTLGIGLAEVLAKVTFYYLHERIWDRIAWGRKKHSLFALPIKRDLELKDMEIIENQLKKFVFPN